MYAARLSTSNLASSISSFRHAVFPNNLFDGGLFDILVADNKFGEHNYPSSVLFGAYIDKLFEDPVPAKAFFMNQHELRHIREVYSRNELREEMMDSSIIRDC